MLTYDFSGQDLSGVTFAGATLTEANFVRATLSGANLAWATLSGANLTGADLRWANLVRADLREADLTGARLTNADLAGADLAGAVGLAEVVGLAGWGKQVALLERIRDAVLAEPERFDMSHWHGPCGTTHCLAGWAQHLTGAKGHASIVASGLIPVAAHIFYDDTADVRRWLEDRAWVSDAHAWGAEIAL